MIYLIDNGQYYKVNFTTNIRKWLNLKQNKRNYKIISYKPGLRSSVDEIKQLIKNYKYKGEWYNKDSKIIEIFNNYQWKFDFEKVWEAYKKHLINCLQNLDFTFFTYNGLDIFDFRQINADLKFCNLLELGDRLRCLEELQELVQAQLTTGAADNPYKIFPGVAVVAGIKLPNGWQRLIIQDSYMKTAFKNTMNEVNKIIKIIKSSN